MRVIIARELGFCSGVRHAIEAAEKALGSSHTVIATDTLLHNTEEMDRLASLGLKSVSETDSSAVEDAIVLLPAHGSTLAEHSEWSQRAREVLDLTCPIVNRAHNAAKRFAEQGMPVIVVGDKEHRETRYLMEAAGSHLLAVVGSKVDLETLVTPTVPIGLIYQTTQSREFRLQVLKWFEKAGVDVIEEMTLCPEVLRRQDEAVAIARQSTVLLVLGDHSSANTRRLVAVAGAACRRTYLVADSWAVLELGLVCTDTVGVVSGTSCPKAAIDQVLDRLGSICRDIVVEVDSLQRAT